MNLVRNTTKDGSCKYALIRLDKMRKDGTFKNIEQFVNKYPELKEYVEFGEPHSEEEFFAIKLKDINSTRALVNYALEADKTDQEFALQVMDLALRSGKRHTKCQQPDLLETSSSKRITQKMIEEHNRKLFNASITPHFPKSKLRPELYDPLKSKKPNVPVPPSPPNINKPEPQYSSEDFSTPLPNKSGFDGEDVGFFKCLWLDIKSLFK